MKPSRLTVKGATVVLLVGLAGQLGLALAGGTSYANQATGLGRTHIATLLTPFAPWFAFGGVMFIWLWRQGRTSRAIVWAVLGVELGTHLGLVVINGLTYPLAVSALTLAFIATALRFIRLRWVVVAIALIPLVWPPLYNFRNGIRQSQVSTQQFQARPTAPASQRLREDLNFAGILMLPVIPDRSIAPSISTLLQFGLVPRFLDRNRGSLETANEITVAQGGPITSASTLTTIGDAYGLQGWRGVVAFALITTLAMALALRRRSPWGYLFAATLVSSAVWIEATYPDFIASVLQSLVSLAAAAIVVTAIAAFERPRPNLVAQPLPGSAHHPTALAPSTRAMSYNVHHRRAIIETRAAHYQSLRPRDPSRDSAPAGPAAPKTRAGSREAKALRRVIGRASVLNVASTAAASLAGLLAARYLGPSVKGQYAAVIAWFGAFVILGELGQQAAIVYYVAHNPKRARDYVTTSRNIMLVTGSLATLAGVFLAPALAHGHDGEMLAYRVIFLCCPLAFVSSSFMFAMQARNIQRWVVLRTVQPISYLVFTLLLVLLNRLTLDTAVAVVAASVVFQALMSRWSCAREGLLGGRYDRALGRQVVRYGVSQMLSTTPTKINVNLDQLVLSQAVASSSLGQYSLAATLTSIAVPCVAPIGSVLFPRLARGRGDLRAAERIQWMAIGITCAFSIIVMAALGTLAAWLVPLAFGDGYRPSVELIWIMLPAGVFLPVNQVAGDLLRGRGQPLAVAAAQLAGAALTVMMLIILIPLYGVAGASITTSVAYGIVTVILIGALRRRREVEVAA